MFDRLKLRLNAFAGRYGDAAAPVCCGVCKPCVTTAATGLVVGLAGASVAAVAGRHTETDPPDPSQVEG